MCKALKDYVELQCPLVVQGTVVTTGVQGERGPENSDVHWLIIYRFNWLLEICFVKYHISEDRLSIVESSGGVETLRNVSAYHEPAWHFDGKFANDQGHVRANVQRAPGHDHF